MHVLMLLMLIQDILAGMTAATSDVSIANVVELRCNIPAGAARIVSYHSTC